MEFDWDGSRQAFADAAQWFVATVALVGDRWDQPGLGEWDVRDLVGHTSRSLLTIETYLAQPAETVVHDSAAAYVCAAREVARGPEVAERGRVAGAALGDDPPGAVAEMAARVGLLVDACAGDELVSTVVGGMRLSAYLPTRTFELAVHTADLALALGEPIDVPPSASAQALALVAEIALRDRTAGPLLLLATGRTALPGRFSVL